MKKGFGSIGAIVAAIVLSFQLHAAEMTQGQLHSILKAQADNVEVTGNIVSMSFQQVEMYCISDVNADRMRIISPIALIGDVPDEMLLIAMAANFHSALDARYAIGNGTVYAAYIHPLSALSESQIISALHQVAAAKTNFGSSYSSGELVFPATDNPGSEADKTPGTLL